MFHRMRRSIGLALARYLSAPMASYRPLTTSAAPTLAATLQPGDVLLVEGNTRVSGVIKYLTQSTWSHAALYVGDAFGERDKGEDARVLIEADMINGVWAVPLSRYASFHTRICRPAGLKHEDRQRLVAYAISRVGHAYDMKNMIDLARYFMPLPPMPMRWGRRMLAFGSGDPTKAICSSLIAQAFHSVGYPILPPKRRRSSGPDAVEYNREILYIRHYSVYTPRDFDISPYFSVVKPTLERGFTYRSSSIAEAPVPSSAPRARHSDEFESVLQPEDEQLAYSRDL